MKSKQSKVIHSIFGALVAVTSALLPVLGAAQQPAPGSTHYEVQVVSLLPTGFLPAEISRPSGPFVLIIRIYDHSADTLFDLSAGDQRVLPASLSRLRTRWSRVVDLPAGDHLLQDHLHLRRQLRIHIEQ